MAILCSCQKLVEGKIQPSMVFMVSARMLNHGTGEAEHGTSHDEPDNATAKPVAHSSTLWDCISLARTLLGSTQKLGMRIQKL
jgi:hypothetical protein